MSKYDAIRAIMGGVEVFNDTSKTGRILKWYSDDSELPKKEREAQAKAIFEKLQHLPYVQKVQVRNAQTTRYGVTYYDYDKICVYIDRI